MVRVRVRVTVPVRVRISATVPVRVVVNLKGKRHGLPSAD